MERSSTSEQVNRIALQVVKCLSSLISVMKDAREQISCGRPLEEIPVSCYEIYLARTENESDQGEAKAVVCVMDFQDFIDLLDREAIASGLCLEEEFELEVTLPVPEFEAELVTGGFENFKGILVERHNKCLDDLMDAVSSHLGEQGLTISYISDEDVIFYLPLGGVDILRMNGGEAI